MQRPVKIGLVYGSARSGRFCDTVANWIAQRMSVYGNLEITTIDPIDPALKTLEGTISEPAVRARLSNADAFVIVTPEYNHGYTAALKALIDAGRSDWMAKPAAFVSYGGISGGLRAVEQLRQVFAELHVVGLRDGVSFANAWSAFDETGQPCSREDAELAAFRMLHRLDWWASALRTARVESPYEAAA